MIVLFSAFYTYLFEWAWVVLNIIYAIPTIFYILMLCNNTRATRKTFASMYFISCIIGIVFFLILSMIDLFIWQSLLSAAINLCIDYYFYLCLKSYALEGTLEGLQQVVIQQPGAQTVVMSGQ